MHLILTRETILYCSQPEQENRSDRRGDIKCYQDRQLVREATNRPLQTLPQSRFLPASLATLL